MSDDKKQVQVSFTRRKSMREFTVIELSTILFGLQLTLDHLSDGDEGKKEITDLIEAIDEEYWRKRQEEEKHERLLNS